MAWATTKGFCFRATSGYVTDPTNTTYVILSDVYNVTRSIGGENVTFGWDSATNVDSRDRNTGAPNELAGLNYIDNTAVRYFRVDVPAAGSYRIQYASGDRGFNPSKSNLKVKDGVGGSVLLTIQDSDIAAGAFVDAGGTERTNAADWDSNGRVWSSPFTITGTVITFYIEYDATYTVPSIAFLNIEQLPAGGANLTEGKLINSSLIRG